MPQGNLAVGRQRARHARAPQDLPVDRRIHRLVDVRELLEHLLHAGASAGDELELALAEVGGDVRVGQRRERKKSVGARAQALLLDAATHAPEQRVVQRSE
jgi:hypothetical protein